MIWKIFIWLKETKYWYFCRNPFKSTFKPHIAALILARGGSKSVPLKNIAKVGNLSLLANSLQIIFKTEGFSSVWVSTDHDLIISESTTSEIYFSYAITKLNS